MDYIMDFCPPHFGKGANIQSALFLECFFMYSVVFPPLYANCYSDLDLHFYCRYTILKLYCHHEIVARGGIILGRQLYELIPEEGNHLADSHDTEGAVRGVYLDDETNKPCGAGEFMPVDIDEVEDNDPINDYDSDGSLDGNALAIAGILVIGIGIGVAATKAYPHVKKWITTTAVPGVKKFWRKVTKKGPELEESIECTGAEIISALPEPEEFSQSIDLAVKEYHADMSSEEAQQHLLNIMCAAMYMASEIRQLTNTTLKDEDCLVWRATLEKLTTQSVTDGINRILEEKVLALDAEQVKTLTDCLGGALFVNGAFVPIENGRIKEALFVYPNGLVGEGVNFRLMPQ